MTYLLSRQKVFFKKFTTETLILIYFLSVIEKYFENDVYNNKRQTFSNDPFVINMYCYRCIYDKNIIYMLHFLLFEGQNSAAIKLYIQYTCILSLV